MKNKNCAKNIDKIYTDEEVDYIAITYNNEVYLFKPNYSSALTVRISMPTYPNQHWLEDYRIDKVLNFEYISWLSQKEQERKEKKQSKKENTCRICGSPISDDAVLCVFCYKREKAQASKRISKDLLKEEILSVKNKKTSFVQLGKKYGVTDNTIRKWCKYYNLPFKVNDLKNLTEEEIVGL